MNDTNGDPLPSITDMLRARTKPQGTANVTYLELGSLFYDHDFIQQCIEELERIPKMAVLGEMPSPLQKLAYDILIKGCHLDQDIENAQRRTPS